MATLAAKILALNDGKKSTREIAEKVYGKATDKQMAYVRVVLRQRRGTRSSENDRGYIASSLGQAAQKRKNQKTVAANRVLRETGDHARANDAWRRTFRVAKREGESRQQARRLAGRARESILRRTGDKTAARMAYRQASATSLQGEMR